jgi:hypothetical protein
MEQNASVQSGDASAPSGVELAPGGKVSTPADFTVKLVRAGEVVRTPS